MKLFIFRPCRNWEYMGGAVIFVAERFEVIESIVRGEIQAAEARKKPWESIHERTYLERPFLLTDHTERGHAPAEDLCSYGHWVLDNQFDLAGERAQGLVFENHHDG